MNAEKLVEVVLEAYKAGKSDGIHEGYELCRNAQQESEEVEEGETYDDGYASGYEVGYEDACREAAKTPDDYEKGYNAGFEEADAAAEEEIEKLKALLKDMASIRMQWPEELVEQYNKIMD